MFLHLVANPTAGGGRAADAFRAAHERLASEARVEGHLPESPERAASLLEGLVAERAERVVVLGGDGIVHLAANALAGSETVLGIVPAGTGNDAATGLGLPTKLDDACDVALGAPSSIDLIERDGRYAMTVAIVGLAVAINERAEGMRFPRGAIKYTVATLAELPRLQCHELTVTIDGVEHDVATNLLAIGNLPYFGGGMKIAPDADPADGSLELVSIGPAGRLAIAGLLPTVFGGRHVRNKRVTVLRGSEITIEGADLGMRADGEAWGELPATLRAAPSALRVATGN